MRYYWYVARENELFCDLDLTDKTLKRLLLARARLRGAKESGALNWEEFTFYQSLTPYHYHLMVKTHVSLDPYARILWESRFCDDMYRNNMNFARLQVGGRSWSLLITPIARSNYWRPCDFSCACPKKHKADVMAECPVAKGLECALAADHFGKPIYLDDAILLGTASKK